MQILQYLLLHMRLVTRRLTNGL